MIKLNFSLPEEAKLDWKDVLPTALQQLDGNCDGARTRDDIGFAAFHTAYGKRFAAFFRNHGYLRQEMINWCEDAFSYYFNTQLSWVDKIELKNSCEYWRGIALDHQANESKFIESLADEKQLLAYFRKLNVDMFKGTNGNDWMFVNSMKNQLNNKGFLSAKQMIYVKKFVVQKKDQLEKLND